MANERIEASVDSARDIVFQQVTLPDGRVGYVMAVGLVAGAAIDIGDVTLLPGEAHVGNVGEHTVKVAGTVTRPANATTYHVRDVIGTAVTANISLANIARINGGTGMIFKVRVVCDVNQTLKPSLEVWLFDVAPAAAADHAAFAPTDAAMLNVQAVIPLPNSYVGNAGAAAAGNIILISDTVPFSFKCSAGSKNLTAVLVVTNAYIPVDADVFTLIVDAVQD
jgi:hypothetical protein